MERRCGATGRASVPISVLLWLLISGYSAAYVAAGSALSVVLASWFLREQAIGPRRFIEACVETCHAMVPLTAAVAAGGIIIGAIELTGLAGKFTLLLFQLSGGLMLPSLLLAGVVLILLGTGMPTTATYIMGVALLAPIFIGKFGMPVMEVHMFMLFYASLSAISPPVAVAAFAAAAIAKANPFKLMPYACKLSVGGFVLPFFFVFNPGILMQGGVLHILSDTVVAIVLVVTSALVLHGFVRQRPIPLPFRVVLRPDGAGDGDPAACDSICGGDGCRLILSGAAAGGAGRSRAGAKARCDVRRIRPDASRWRWLRPSPCPAPVGDDCPRRVVAGRPGDAATGVSA